MPILWGCCGFGFPDGDQMTPFKRHLIGDCGLTKREADVAEQVCLGLSNKNIARSLFVEECTVKWHLNTVYRKLDLKNRTQLMMKFYRSVSA